jgi:phage-related holin
MHHVAGKVHMSANGLLARAVAGVAAAIGELHHVTPGHVERLVLVCFILIVVDTVTGAWLAATQAELRSRTLLRKLLAKGLQYATLIALGGGAAVLACQWALVSAALGLIVAIESISLIENLSLLEACGGVNMGPAKPFLDRVRKHLAVVYEEERKP